MTVGEIIKAVRWCIDEEQMNLSNMSAAGENEFGLMDRIIKAKIGDAVRWICLYAPSELLGGSDSSQSTGILVDATQTPSSITGTNGGRITMPADFIKLARVRITGWHRAVRTPLAEDSNEYLQLRDEYGAEAPVDRPMAALIEKAQREIEVWPTGTSAEVTYVKDPNISVDADSADSQTVPLPPRTKSAFIYYLTFLLLSAYGDARAERMLEIAKMNIGRNG